jgi:hypothetical protein
VATESREQLKQPYVSEFGLVSQASHYTVGVCGTRLLHIHLLEGWECFFNGGLCASFLVAYFQTCSEDEFQAKELEEDIFKCQEPKQQNIVRIESQCGALCQNLVTNQNLLVVLTI